MRLAYADPPYPGQAAKHYFDHPDYKGEVDHAALLRWLNTDFDGWVYHTASTTLSAVLISAAEWGITGFRVMSWVKPFAAFKRNVSVAYAWEPVLVKPVRKPVVSGRMVMRDWLAESITLKRGLAGAKPERLCRWLFEVAGLGPEDELIDLFPGTGAVGRAWQMWRWERLVEAAHCIFKPCVATWAHEHGGFPGGYDNPDDPEGSPIRFTGPDPDPTAVRDYNGAVLTSRAIEDQSNA